MLFDGYCNHTSIDFIQFYEKMNNKNICLNNISDAYRRNYQRY